MDRARRPSPGSSSIAGSTTRVAWVGERLGTAEERVSTCEVADLIGRTFDDLNFLILERPIDTPAFRGPFAAPDDLFEQPGSGPILLTHQDVRAVTLARFRDLPAGPIWDVGAGLGGVSIDLARAFRGVEVIGFERSPVQAEFLIENRRRFATYNLRVVVGQAPGCLVDEARPAAIFLGGSGGQLDAILDVACDRLIAGGVLVANFVGLENLARFRERMGEAGWSFELTQVQVNHGRPLGGLTSLVPIRPVWVVHSRRPVDQGPSLRLNP